MIPAALLDASLEREKDYWLSRLAGAPAGSGIPIDFKRESVFAGRNGSVSLEIAPETQERTMRVCNNNATLVLAALISAAKVCLFKYTGIDDVIVGTPIHEQHAEIAALNKVLAVRDEIAEGMSFRELLLSVRQTLGEAYTYQKYPFERIIELLEITAPSNQCALFNLVVLNRNINERNKISHLKHDATLAFRVLDGCLSGVIEYNNRLFKRESIEGFAGHYSRVLDAMFQSPDSAIERLDLASDEEKRLVLYEFNDTRVDNPPNKTIGDLFEEQVDRSPASIAVSFADEHVTYGELNRRANRLGGYLGRAGVGPNVLVGLYLERSVEMVTALLGVIKSGGAYVPLDPGLPRERLISILTDADCPVVLTQDRLRQNLADLPCRVFSLDAGWQAAECESTANPDSPTFAVAPVYVIYTSGSTGRPKGVMITHEGLYNHMLWMQRDYPLDHRDRVLQKTPYTFDASVWEFYLPLLSGATLVMAQPGGHLDSGYLVRTVREESISVIQLVPTMLDLVLEEDGIESCATLRNLFCGGEALTADLQDRVFSRVGAELINLYGPTEATVQTVVWRCQRGSRTCLVPIGRPISNTRVYVVDHVMNVVPIGMVGELYLGGICVGRGYLGRPDLTAEKFIPDHFGDAAAARLYKTGDLARYRRDGTIECLGRVDHQVKFRGFRVELEEIEAALSRHPAIRGAIVNPVEYAPGQSHLVAYIVGRKRITASFSDLRNYLRELLPDYMIPSSFVLLRSLPLLPNGKVNRRALSEMEALKPEVAAGYVPPRDEIERTLAGIWRDVLKVETVGVTDNFFDLGGHSLLMFQMHAMLRKEFARDLSTIDLFKYPTIAALAQHLSSEQVDAPSFAAEQEQVQKKKQALLRRRQFVSEANSI